MSNTSQWVKSLIQDMVTDRNHYTLLREKLTAQRESMILRDIPALERINNEIIALYQQLAANSQQRYSLLKQLGIADGEKGLLTLFSRLPVNVQNQVRQLWLELESIANTCKITNDANGMLLNMQNDILHKLINTGDPENWLYQRI
ncbi:flagellar export chaperone FlgN [Enterobacter ludwigii]|uniref:flagellar export chaperone FlgN n=1 Tax=Enterobacter ludwigii TaxID=299767 RepID=UPI003F723446